jgi:hypothetical protein
MMHGVALALALVAASACSYGPAFEDCRIAVCRGPDDCPSGFTCDGAGYCRAPGATASCAAILVDGGVDGKPPGDGTSARCTGAVVTCTTFTTNAACVTQTGCGWVAPTCTVTTNCGMYMTNLACMNAPECVTDFSTSTCVRRGNYCSGATRPACEDDPVCKFGGGCTGTADACAAFTSATACNAQMGCAWQ